MKNILLIGVGGTGSHAASILNKKIKDLGKQTDCHITAIVFDTDVGSVEQIKDATPISMADPASVGTICDRVGREYIREWFPCDDKAVRSQEMIRGASQWRKKSYLAFLNLMNKPQSRSAFISALEDMSKDPSDSCEVYVIASLAGGTGSGSFIPIALYVRRYLRKQLGKNPIINAMVALPDIYADAQTPDNKVKVYANAYAILRELNAIYLVARNFNEGDRSQLKSAPVKFRIGNPNEPNVGVLFDADDRQFWTPEAAPFTQIFVLDRIPGVHSIAAHDMVLANSLYTLICTEIGVEFDSEASNHEILRSQNNGSNAIYASVSTSQMSFPTETVLDYLAHEKALDSCNGEWMILHREVEKKIQEKEQEFADDNRKYVLQDDEYAKMVLDELKNDEENGGGKVSELVERGTAVFNKKGEIDREKNTAKEYAETLVKGFNNVIGNYDNVMGKMEETLNVEGNRFKDKNAFIAAIDQVEGNLLEYYRYCLATIKRLANSISEAIITFDPDKDVMAGGNLSLVSGLLKKGKKFIHPVSAMVQLCRLRVLIGEKANRSFEEWPDIRKRDVYGIPDDLLISEDLTSIEVPVSIKKSAYALSEEDKRAQRFCDIINKGGETYLKAKKRTNYAADKAFFEADAKYIANNIRNKSVEQLKQKVYKKLLKELDLLIEKYRNFFNRFEKEKENLVDETKTVLKKDCDLVDSILYIYSSVKDKNEIKENINRTIGAETSSGLEDTDDVVGEGVFKSVYKVARTSYNDSEAVDEADAEAYRNIFASMIQSYNSFIRKSDAFKRISSFNILEAIAASCEVNKNDKEAFFRECFSKIQSLATPPLKIDTRIELGDFVQPSTIIVFMMSYETARYIKKHAEELKLTLPQSDVSEKELIKACASAFIQKYSGNDSARVTIVKNMKDNVLYCTGEIMDITPLRIPKFNELSDENDNIYYQNYVKAIRNFKHYDTDMWNPHLGNNLFQRGYLPFMNVKKEQIEDVKMAKALIYGLAEKKIIYSNGLNQSKDIYCFRIVENGIKRVIKGSKGNIVGINNIAELLDWLRIEDDLVESWSAEFDARLEHEKRMLPNVTTKAQITVLESALTRSQFMGYLLDELLDIKGRKVTLLELAYMIKTSEESSRDCDYADRILITAYDIFKDIIAYRANPESMPEEFDQVYKQQLENVFEALAKSKIVQDVGKDCENFFMLIVGWCESRNCFLVEPIQDESGAPLMKFSLERYNSKKVNDKLESIKKKAKEVKEVKEEKA
ncbi:MAG: hypothetical protein IJQ66_01605 [Clostridia bacterium]|nr:hypothetical protein [Clostridia bacterium]